MYQEGRYLWRFIVPMLALLLGADLLIGTVTLAGAGSQVDAASVPKSQGGDGCWRTVPVPTTGPPYGVLHGVVTLSEDDAWAVGGHDKGLIYHWDGVQWNIARSSSLWRLSGISAVAPDDIWAVGSQGEGILTMHWEGFNGVLSQPLSQNQYRS